MKTKDTLAVEAILLRTCFGSNPSLARRYGCSEVTLGFAYDKFENKEQRVDFMSYDRKNKMFFCYEIKVSYEDLHSKAAKSWYGNYNYLVISDKLSREIEDKDEDITSYLPNGVGLIVCNLSNRTTKTVIKPKKQILSWETVELLKDSMIRSMFYRIRRLEKNAQNENSKN